MDEDESTNLCISPGACHAKDAETIQTRSFNTACNNLTLSKSNIAEVIASESDFSDFEPHKEITNSKTKVKNQKFLNSKPPVFTMIRTAAKVTLSQKGFKIRGVRDDIKEDIKEHIRALEIQMKAGS